jgi:acetylornithine deacetylase/succinyl-diaminopimelate desuccinylase-like protein
LGWESDPFKLTARNGYLYARGVADDKGPVLATACAAADLLRARKLGVDLLFLVEGEEETGKRWICEYCVEAQGACWSFVDFERADGLVTTYRISSER